MRRSAVVAAAAVALLLPLVESAPAWAGPAVDLCVPEPARGSVPGDFVLDACVAATGVTLRNGLEHPVVVGASGDVGAAIRGEKADGPDAKLVRLAGGDDVVLVPGDVVSWPLGAGAADLVVSGLPAPATPAVADTLRGYLPRRGDQDVPPDTLRAYAALIREMTGAVADRAACRDGKNFLQAAACDVDTASAIGRQVVVQLSRNDAATVTPVILDPARWDDWEDIAPPDLGTPAERTLHLEPSVVPVAAPPVAPAGEPLPGVPAPPHPVPAPPPVVVVAPAPVPAPVPAPPAPAPAPAPVPAAAPAPAPGPSVTGGEVMGPTQRHGPPPGRGWRRPDHPRHR